MGNVICIYCRSNRLEGFCCNHSATHFIKPLVEFNIYEAIINGINEKRIRKWLTPKFEDTIREIINARVKQKKEKLNENI
jgi:hypothetical protein